MAEGINTVMVYIHEMPGSFRGHHISSFIRIYGMFREVAYIPLIEEHHLRRQQKNGVVIDLLMHVKTPAEHTAADQQAANAQHSLLHDKKLNAANSAGPEFLLIAIRQEEGSILNLGNSSGNREFHRIG
jgi:hypothetical protein